MIMVTPKSAHETTRPMILTRISFLMPMLSLLSGDDMLSFVARDVGRGEEGRDEARRGGRARRDEVK